MHFKGVQLLVLLAIFAANVEAYKFLAVLPWPGRSHFIVASSLIKALAKKGHEVTVISPFPQQKPLKNYHDIPVLSVKQAMESDIKNLFQWYDTDFVTNHIKLLDMGIRSTKATLEEPKVQELLRSNQTFDAVICEVFVAEALYGFSEHFKAPLIGFSAMGAHSWNTEMIGSPSPPSYVPHIFSSFTERMTRWERLINLAILTFEHLHSQFVYLPRQAALYEQYFPHAKRSMYDVRKNAALMLMNQHISLSFSRPYMPNQVEIGGMHINRKQNPLPADIQRFIDEAEHGVIYFSMGSNLKSTNLPLEKRQAMLNAFRSLKQRILWKFEESNLPGKPENVYISDWFPQDDILAHPNVKLFITHGGLLSTTESIYHGKPVIGIPIFSDQFLNMERAVRYGYGVLLNYAKLSLESFKGAIDEVLNNPAYTERVREISRRYRDKPMEPLELAIYWVEHVVRHNGAAYMHCAGLDLNFIEYHNLDVILILYGGFALVLCVFLVVMIKVGRKCLQKSENAKNVKNSKKPQKTKAKKTKRN